MNAQELKAAFAQYFKLQCDGVMYAPGRVNLIGEHTDYNDGFVLPCAIEFKNIVAFRKREDGVVRIVSCNYELQEDEFSVNQAIKPGEKRWANYVRAVAYVLKKQGHAIDGADLMMFGDVPQGTGLSSSAALEVCIGACFNEISELGLAPAKLAQIGQQAENEFMDCQCGIMDQMISALGQQGHALLIDCEDNSSQAIPVPNDLSVLIINSNFKRELVDSEYNTRRLDCEAAVQALGVKSLRYANLEQLEEQRTSMSSNAYKRALHIITENQRTLDAAEALRSNDYSTLYTLLKQAHISIRDDFEIVVPQTDALVAICNEVLGDQGAARQTGGGFGGCIIVLCKPENVEKVIAAVDERYEAQFGLRADCYIAKPSIGLHRAI